MMSVSPARPAVGCRLGSPVRRSLSLVRAGAMLAGLLYAGSVLAAGGHHAVDDAAILDEGLCKLEGWLSGRSDSERLLHAAGGCRLGPVELNAATEYSRPGDGGSQTAPALQVKWATDVAERFSVGLVAQANWQAHVRPRFQGQTLVGLATWAARDGLAFHLNLGRDFVRGGDDQDRGGVSVEWKPRPDWSVVAERYLEGGSHFVRAGIRKALTESWSVDLSRAQKLHGPGSSSWTVGTTWQFQRP